MQAAVPQTRACKTTLINLPTEMLLLDTSYLLHSGLVSLKLTNRNLHHRIPPLGAGQLKTATACEKKATRRYIKERADELAGRRTCVLCDGLQPLLRFESPGMPVCKWHDGWFIAKSPPVYLEPGLLHRLAQCSRPSSSSRWFAIPRSMCLHCKDTLLWDVHHCQCPKGGCDSCGMLKVTCFVRLSSISDTPRSSQLRKTADG